MASYYRTCKTYDEKVLAYRDFLFDTDLSAAICKAKILVVVGKGGSGKTAAMGDPRLEKSRYTVIVQHESGARPQIWESGNKGVKMIYHRLSYDSFTQALVEEYGAENAIVVEFVESDYTS